MNPEGGVRAPGLRACPTELSDPFNPTTTIDYAAEREVDNGSFGAMSFCAYAGNGYCILSTMLSPVDIVPHLESLADTAFDLASKKTPEDADLARFNRAVNQLVYRVHNSPLADEMLEQKILALKVDYDESRDHTRPRATHLLWFLALVVAMFNAVLLIFGMVTAGVVEGCRTQGRVRKLMEAQARVNRLSYQLQGFVILGPQPHADTPPTPIPIRKRIIIFLAIMGALFLLLSRD